VAFWAWWFGAKHFDVDGDGDFDVQDVAKFMYRRKKEAKKEIGAEFNLDQNQDGSIDVADVLESDVQGVAVEDETKENLKRRPPLFMICEVLLCLGLWVGGAFSAAQYVSGVTNQRGTAAVNWCNDGTCGSEYMWTNNEKDYAGCKSECNNYDGCLGIAYRNSLPSTCILLSTLSTVSGQDTEFFQSMKAPFSMSRALNSVAGMENIWPGKTTLRLNGGRCQDYGYEVWRWITYQFTHAGTTHVMMNQVMNLLLGIPIEGLHGPIRALLLYNLGVLGGALCYVLGDAHRAVVGCSGGCYALLGLHLGQLLLNWKQTRYRKPVLFMLFMIATVELVTYHAISSGGQDNKSHTAHVGGFGTGLFAVVLLGRNTVVTRMDRVLQAIAAVGLGFAFIWSISWWLTNPFPATRNIYVDTVDADMDAEPWCWQGQFWQDASVGWQCIRCQTEECIKQWYAEYPLQVAQANTAVCSDLPFLSTWK
jgi:membrane associated rhomboid family serine protease